MQDDLISQEVLARARATWSKRMQRRVDWNGSDALPSGRFFQAVLFHDARPGEYMDWLVVEADAPPAWFWVRRCDNTEEPDQREYVPREGETVAGPFRL